MIYKKPDDVPAPPGDDDGWDVALRWMLAVMNHDDTAMSFVAGCLSYLVKPHGGRLTDRQVRGCEKVLSRLMADFETLQLDCQQGQVA